MNLGKKVRLKPTEEQEKLLWRTSGASRWAYNWTLARQEENYRNGGKFIPDWELRKELTVLKQSDEYSWLYEVSSAAPRKAIKDACEAYRNFFKKLVGKPQFKSKKHSKPSFYNDNCKIKVKENMILIEKVGWISTSQQFPIGVKCTNPRVSFDGKYWYISVGIEREVNNVELSIEVIGIDVGVKELAVCSNGMKFKNINKTKEVKKTEKRLRRLQRKVSQKYHVNKKGNQFIKTNNIVKIEKKIKRLYRRLTGIRDNHIHQATNAIVKTKPCKVVMETLNINGIMKNKHLSKAIAQQKLFEFKTKLKYKCEKNGIAFIEVDKWFPSSKTCSCCGNIKKDLKLSDRTYKCDCGFELDRDLNASINLANYGKLVV